MTAARFRAELQPFISFSRHRASPRLTVSNIQALQGRGRANSQQYDLAHAGALPHPRSRGMGPAKRCASTMGNRVPDYFGVNCERS
jgi:hypothetical protein